MRILRSNWRMTRDQRGLNSRVCTPTLSTMGTTYRINLTKGERSHQAMLSNSSCPKLTTSVKYKN